MEEYKLQENTPKSNFEKRFQMPEDENLRERLKGIQHVMKDFQRQSLQ